MIRFLCFLSYLSFTNCLYFNDGFEKSFKYKIVGGRSIDVKFAPYLAQIVKDGIQICGGSIITKEWILTAAHCFDNIKGRNISVITGSPWQGKGQSHRLAAVHIPRSYKKVPVDNDIALIKLRQPITFGKSQKAIAISTSPPKIGDKVKISGFGKIGVNLGYSDNLKAAFVTVIDQHKCQKRYANYISITENMFCAFGKGTDSCQGDSGGPAVINRELSGIISFGKGCGSSYYPGVYTRVYEYRKWIAAKTGLEL